tara:strand:- start:70887 stop:71084 length:198 start_codon:yes stop_codon:yes gene_type:complete
VKSVDLEGIKNDMSTADLEYEIEKNILRLLSSRTKVSYEQACKGPSILDLIGEDKLKEIMDEFKK